MSNMKTRRGTRSTAVRACPRWMAPPASPLSTGQFQALKAHPSGPLLLYFTGHGGPAEDGGYDNNEYDMWDGDALTVRHLAARI